MGAQSYMLSEAARTHLPQYLCRALRPAWARLPGKGTTNFRRRHHHHQCTRSRRRPRAAQSLPPTCIAAAAAGSTAARCGRNIAPQRSVGASVERAGAGQLAACRGRAARALCHSCASASLPCRTNNMPAQLSSRGAAAPGACSCSTKVRPAHAGYGEMLQILCLVMASPPRCATPHPLGHHWKQSIPSGTSRHPGAAAQPAGAGATAQP